VSLNAATLTVRMLPIPNSRIKHLTLF
jgi:hypothetical protein